MREACWQGELPEIHTKYPGVCLHCSVDLGWFEWDLYTARRSNQSILKEISPGISLEGMMLKLKLQYFGHLMWRVDSLEKTLCWEGLWAGGEGDDRGWDGWMASLTRWMWVWVNSRSWWWTGRPGMLRFMGSQRVGHDWAIELNWTVHYWIPGLDLKQGWFWIKWADRELSLHLLRQLVFHICAEFWWKRRKRCNMS